MTKLEEITKLFKPYIVRQNNGQCQILLPLIELDNFVESIFKSMSKLDRGLPKPVKGGHSKDYCLGYKHGRVDALL